VPDDPALDICFDRLPPGGDVMAAATTALAERPTNRPSNTVEEPKTEADAFRLAVVTSKLWRPGRTLRIAFSGGADGLRTRVLDYAKQWLAHAFVRFERVNDDKDAEIRIAFARSGHWSSVGTDALGVERLLPTMNLQLTPHSAEETIRRATLHEFGHVLGCLHEHQSLGAAIPWNEQAVFARYSGPPNHWDEATTRSQVIDHYTDLPSQFSKFDTTSIMIYPIPKELTDGVFEVAWNTQLSETDRTFIAKRYPRVEVDGPEIPVDGSEVAGHIAAPGAMNQFLFTINVAGTYVIRTTGYQALKAELYGPGDFTDLRAADSGSGRIGNVQLEEGLSSGPYLLRIRHHDPNAAGQYNVSVRIQGDDHR
jgi:hypothetical protein